jgi:hypothetical protein
VLPVLASQLKLTWRWTTLNACVKRRIGHTL